MTLLNSAWILINRELEQRRFWATHVKRKWYLFHFKAPWRYQICISKCLYYYRGHFSKHLGETTVKKWKKKRSLPVDASRSKTSSLKLTNSSAKSQNFTDTKTEGIRTCQSNLRNHHHPNVCKISRLCGTIYSLVWVSLKRQPYLFQGVLSNGANVFSPTDPPESL